MKTKSLALFVLLMVAVMLAAQNTYTGYTLYSKMGSTKTYLLNMDKTIYHSWTCSPVTGYSTYLLPNQHILRSAQYSGNQLMGAAMCGMVQDVDWNGNITWQYIYSTSTYCTHHDICPMPNGNVLLIAYEVKPPSQVTQAGCSQSITMWPDKIVEIQPSGSSGGTVVWEWHAWDHLCQNFNSSKDNYVTSIAQHPELLNINYLTQKDWMHTNGIDYNAGLDQIIISSHNLNEVYVIDHSTTTAQAAGHTGGNSGKGGDILYRWGNPQAYSCGTSANQVFKVVHDAHWIPLGCPHANDIVGFNNQGGSGNGSCIDRITPPYNGYNYTGTPGTAYTPSTYGWRHNCLADADNQSNSQQLPNGNTLVCIASTGYIYEIDSNQNLLWSHTTGGTVAQAFRYPTCYVNGTMSVDATASPGTICLGGSTQLNATVTNATGATYSWTSVPSGFTSTAQNPTASPTVNTMYYVTASVGSCTATDSISVTVNPAMTVSATATPPSICPGESSQLNAVPTGGTTYTYAWESIPVGFTSTLQNPVVTPSVNTTYYVTVTSSTCTASSFTTITINNPLSVTASATPSSICPGESSQLNATASGGTTYTYSWTSNPAGFTSTSQNPVVTPLVTTTYFVTTTSGSCYASNQVTVAIANPLAVTASASPGDICYGESSQLACAPTGGSNYTYSWSSTPAGYSSTLQNPVVAPLVTTQYSVLVTSGSCSATASTTVYVNGPLFSQASATPLQVCSGGEIQLGVFATGGSTYTFCWTSIPAGFTSSIMDPLDYPTQNTTYIVTTQSYPCVSIDSVSVEVYPLPATPVITMTGDTLFSNIVSGNQWFVNGATIYGATGAFYIPLCSGSYQVQVIDANGCTSELSTPYLVTGLSDNSATEIAVYPNPSHGSITVEGIFSSGDPGLVIFNMAGNAVFESLSKKTVDVSELCNGVYFLQIFLSGKLVTTEKIIILK